MRQRHAAACRVRFRGRPLLWRIPQGMRPPCRPRRATRCRLPRVRRQGMEASSRAAGDAIALTVPRRRCRRSLFSVVWHRLCETEPSPAVVLSQVVLPHPKKQELDVVVFLDDSQAAPSQEEAEQRAAVAALHRVQAGAAPLRIEPGCACAGCSAEAAAVRRGPPYVSHGGPRARAPARLHPAAHFSCSSECGALLMCQQA